MKLYSNFRGHAILRKLYCATQHKDNKSLASARACVWGILNETGRPDMLEACKAVCSHDATAMRRQRRIGRTPCATTLRRTLQKLAGAAQPHCVARRRPCLRARLRARHSAEPGAGADVPHKPLAKDEKWPRTRNGRKTSRRCADTMRGVSPLRTCAPHGPTVLRSAGPTHRCVSQAFAKASASTPRSFLILASAPRSSMAEASTP